jgi:hypothetical protein
MPAADSDAGGGAGLQRSLVNRHDGRSRFALLEDRLAMLLQSMQARLQSMKHRNGAIGFLSGLSYLLDDPFLRRNTILGHRDVSLGLGKVVLSLDVVHALRYLDCSFSHVRVLLFGWDTRDV